MSDTMRISMTSNSIEDVSDDEVEDKRIGNYRYEQLKEQQQQHLQLQQQEQEVQLQRQLQLQHAERQPRLLHHHQLQQLLIPPTKSPHQTQQQQHRILLPTPPPPQQEQLLQPLLQMQRSLLPTPPLQQPTQPQDIWPRLHYNYLSSLPATEAGISSHLYNRSLSHDPTALQTNSSMYHESLQTGQSMHLLNSSSNVASQSNSTINAVSPVMSTHQYPQENIAWQPNVIPEHGSQSANARDQDDRGQNVLRMFSHPGRLEGHVTSDTTLPHSVSEPKPTSIHPSTASHTQDHGFSLPARGTLFPRLRDIRAQHKQLTECVSVINDKMNTFDKMVNKIKVEIQKNKEQPQLLSTNERLYNLVGVCEIELEEIMEVMRKSTCPASSTEGNSTGSCSISQEPQYLPPMLSHLTSSSVTQSSSFLQSPTSTFSLPPTSAIPLYITSTTSTLTSALTATSSLPSALTTTTPSLPSALTTPSLPSALTTAPSTLPSAPSTLPFALTSAIHLTPSEPLLALPSYSQPQNISGKNCKMHEGTFHYNSVPLVTKVVASPPVLQRPVAVKQEFVDSEAPAPTIQTPQATDDTLKFNFGVVEPVSPVTTTLTTQHPSTIEPATSSHDVPENINIASSRCEESEVVETEAKTTGKKLADSICEYYVNSEEDFSDDDEEFLKNVRINPKALRKYRLQQKMLKKKRNKRKKLGRKNKWAQPRSKAGHSSAEKRDLVPPSMSNLVTTTLVSTESDVVGVEGSGWCKERENTDGVEIVETEKDIALLKEQTLRSSHLDESINSVATGLAYDDQVGDENNIPGKNNNTSSVESRKSSGARNQESCDLPDAGENIREETDRIIGKYPNLVEIKASEGNSEEDRGEKDVCKGEIQENMRCNEKEGKKAQCKVKVQQKNVGIIKVTEERQRNDDTVYVKREAAGKDRKENKGRGDITRRTDNGVNVIITNETKEEEIEVGKVLKAYEGNQEDRSTGDNSKVKENPRLLDDEEKRKACAVKIVLEKVGNCENVNSLQKQFDADNCQPEIMYNQATKEETQLSEPGNISVVSILDSTHNGNGKDAADNKDKQSASAVPAPCDHTSGNAKTKNPKHIKQTKPVLKNGETTHLTTNQLILEKETVTLVTKNVTKVDDTCSKQSDTDCKIKFSNVEGKGALLINQKPVNMNDDNKTLDEDGKNDKLKLKRSYSSEEEGVVTDEEEAADDLRGPRLDTQSIYSSKFKIPRKANDSRNRNHSPRPMSRGRSCQNFMSGRRESSQKSYKSYRGGNTTSITKMAKSWEDNPEKNKYIGPSGNHSTHSREAETRQYPGNQEQRQRSQYPKFYGCNKCGATSRHNNPKLECRAWRDQCNNCYKFGHFTHMCFKKKFVGRSEERMFKGSQHGN